MSLTPTVAGAHADNGVESVGFGEFVELPDRALIVSRLVEPSAQDIAAGQNRYALVDESGRAVYSPFRSVRLAGGSLDATLTDEAQDQLRLSKHLAIELNQLDPELVGSLLAALPRVVTDLVHPEKP
jgi:hypothetical protein